MRTVLLTIILALATASLAAGVAVHPFAAGDPVLGTALAQRVADALGDDVVGPGATPGLVVPIVAPSGFVSPVVFLDDPGLSGRNAAWLLRGVLGVDAALTGSLRVVGDDLVLRLEFDLHGAERRASLRGPIDDPGALADRAARVVAAWLERRAEPLGPFSLAGADGDLARALSLIAAGRPLDALAALEQPGVADDARIERVAALLREGIDGAAAATPPGDLDGAALRAVIALNLGELDAAGDAFAALAVAGVSVGDAWAGAIAHNGGDAGAARAAFDRAAQHGGYDVGVAARAAYLLAVGDADAARADLDALAARERLTPAGALVAVVAANLAADAAREDAFALRLERGAPFLAYGFERRSFLAFDRDDPLVAAQTLAVATELARDSDLYWTNYGWALYLLGFLERSEEASLRALAIDPAQVIARYNLGLVQVVTDRLDDALVSYREALRFDPQVEPEAIVDLIEAEERYPEALGVPYALALLQAARGERQAAAEAYERFVGRAAASPDHPAASSARVREASERAVALRAPLPPIEIASALEARLGRRGPTLQSLKSGDPVVVGFEVSTAGEALPARLELEASLEDGDGTVVASVERSVDVPMGAIGFVVEVARLELPVELGGGTYTLVARAAGDGLEARAVREVEVDGVADVVRRLIGRDVGLLALETEQALVAPRDLAQPEVVIARLVNELRAAAPIAEEVLPIADAGRFAGLGGGEAFERSDADDVRDFLRFLLAEGAADTTLTFVDGYAEWLLAGTP